MLAAARVFRSPRRFVVAWGLWAALAVVAGIVAGPAARAGTPPLAEPVLTIDEGPAGTIVFRARDNSLDHLDLNTLRVWLNGNDITQAFMTLAPQYSVVDPSNTTLRVNLPIAYRLGPYTVLRAEVRRKPEHGGQLAQAVQSWTDPVRALLRKRIRDSLWGTPYALSTEMGLQLHMFDIVWPAVHAVDPTVCFPYYRVALDENGTASLAPPGLVPDLFDSTCAQQPSQPELVEAVLSYAERVGRPATQLVVIGHYRLATTDPQWGGFALIEEP